MSNKTVQEASTSDPAKQPLDESSRAAQALRASSKTLLGNVSRWNLALLLLGYITLLHLTGLYVFTRGFLLTRLSIPLTSDPYTPDSPPPILPTHSKAVILIIDALRTDFISPHYPSPKSPFHHGVLSLPAELSKTRPHNSLIFNSYSDPPTTTMQRIKGLTTGSLPTFVDAGANFASTAIEEDSIISQLVDAGKKVVFMGDDTWGHLFPTSFVHAHPYDSFNVEDLHTVDNGVVEHLFPYLATANSSKWDVLIGHFLGVDHVGHRVGPDTETMRTKQRQMNDVLTRVVDLLDDDTLLVLLGDHGMDPKGNHGGDSDLETAAALWLYSKGSELLGDLEDPKLEDAWQTYIYPGSSTPLRHVNQIDLVPTLSILLGTPIPFNNLGLVIPDCFSDMASLEVATRVNAQQIMRYLTEYSNQDVLATLDTSWQKAQAAVKLLHNLEEKSDGSQGGPRGSKLSQWLHSGSTGSSDEAIQLKTAQHHSIVTHRAVALLALERLRALWAQFSIPLIVCGLVILGLSVLVSIAFYVGVRNNLADWDIFVRLAFDTAALPCLGVTAAAGIATLMYSQKPLLGLEAAGVAAVISSEVVLATPLMFQIGVPRTLSMSRAIGPVILALHALSFASNSFIMWEDRMILFLLNTVSVVYIVKAWTAPTADLRLRVILLSGLSIVLTRLIGAITVCREEQQPYCRVTFFSGSSARAPTWALVITVLLGLQLLPRSVRYILGRSKSYAGPARAFITGPWRAIMVANAVYWVLEWLEFSEGLVPERIPLVKAIRLWLARGTYGAILLHLPYLWAASPLCIDVHRETDSSGEQSVTVFGFANTFGSTYLLFLLIPFSFTHLVSYPMSQMALSAGLYIIVAQLEITDAKRDSIIMARSFAQNGNPGAFEPASSSNGPGTLVRPFFSDSVPMVLLGLLLFFSTGHQAVLTSIQWKAAFVGFETVTYPFSPLLVIINTWGPIALSAIALPLLAVWNMSPRPRAIIPLLAYTVQLCLAFIIYHSTITLASAFFSAWLRRHLMVWKVFAPRYMLAGCTLLVVDLTLLFAVGVGLRLTAWKVWKTFRCETV